ncbi:J domain-containing protein [Athalassotoga saccharophila]|uniref:J domain-containing protein n=1 Tax=Athalassotoga saccharophila TaxID=1441386 RepID=UPI00137A7A3E|nr:J domain-containing protein [Athalassotoga saccharophila]
MKKLKDPYEVLGVRRDATKEEIREAYRDLIKRYHPDQFHNNPDMKALAEEKIKEVNEAYKYILDHFDDPKESSNSSGDEEIFKMARQKIDSGDYYGAQDLLVKVEDKSKPEWYFLSGLIYFKQGWYDKAESYLKFAHEADPSNKEYEEVYKQCLRAGKMNYDPTGPVNQGGMNEETATCLSCCATLACMDICCHCMGGI